MSKKRHTYIVTSVLTGVSGVTSAPVLGVHTSLKIAYAHFLSCVKCAESYKGRVTRWSLGPTDLHNEADQKQGKTELYKAYVSGDDGSGTTITLERW